MMMFKVILPALIAIVCCTSCTKDMTKPSNCNTCLTYSFKANIVPIFQQNCAIPGCHDAGDQAGNLTLDSALAYSQITQSGTGYVNPGSPTTSVLLSQLYTGASNHMPQDGQLDACTIQEIYCWIQEGAKNN